MKISTLLITLFLLAFSASAAKPNFVLIFIDDMGYGDIGPYGSTLNRTPNLDKMAAEGMKLTSFYAAPVCSASRAQLLTGSYAPRVSVPGVFFPAGPVGLNPEEVTVADYLKESGYATMCVGKWHLGDQREFLPTNNGFDGYFGVPYSNDMARTSSETGKSVHPLMRNTEPAELLENEGQRRLTREYTEEAVRFIETHREEPFFLYLPHTAMHVPLFPHPDFAGKSKNGTYGDWVEEVDWSVGEVLAALKEQKLDENTLVIFTSDNGPWASKGKAGGVSGPLRGSKGGTLEGGVREPTIARWPGRIKAGSICDAIAGTTDILPTFVSLAGGKVRSDIIIDGKDISSLLTGERTDSPHEAWYYFAGTKLQAVRAGPWKLAVSSQRLGMGMRESPADLKKAGRLYNLDEEIGEMTDVAAAHPDVVARLQALATAKAKELAENRRPAGRVENPVTLYPTVSRGKRSKPASKSKSKPIDWRKVKKGDTYESGSAPAIAKRAFRVTARISGDSPSGVILAHGGSSIGYSLYAKDGKVTFAVRHESNQIVRVSSPLVSAGNSLVASLADGHLSLRVNSGKPVQAKSALLNRHPMEALCVGHDDRNPLDDAAPGGAFSGTIESASVEFTK
jgi:arylsulfatase A